MANANNPHPESTVPAPSDEDSPSKVRTGTNPAGSWPYPHTPETDESE